MFPKTNTRKGFYRFPSPILGKVLSSPNQYWDRFYRFPRSVQGKGSIVSQSSTGKTSRFPSLLLGNYSGFHSPCSTGKRFSRFLSLYWEKDLQVPQSNTGKSFYRFTSPLLGKGFRFPSPILEKGSIGSSVQRCVKVVYVLKSNTGKKFYRFPSPVLGKGSIGSPVQY